MIRTVTTTTASEINLTQIVILLVIAGLILWFALKIEKKKKND